MFALYGYLTWLEGWVIQALDEELGASTKGAARLDPCDARSVRGPMPAISGPGEPTWCSFSMFVVVRPAGDEAAITTSELPLGDEPRVDAALVHQRDHRVGVVGVLGRAAAPRPSSACSTRRTCSSGMNA